MLLKLMQWWAIYIQSIVKEYFIYSTVEQEPDGVRIAEHTVFQVYKFVKNIDSNM